MKEKIILTDSGKQLLSFLQRSGMSWTENELENLIDVKGVTYTISSLVRDGLIEYTEDVEKEVTNYSGEKVVRVCKAYHLTEKGRLFNIN